MTKAKKSTGFDIDDAMRSINQLEQDYANGLITKGKFITDAIDDLTMVKEKDLLVAHDRAAEYGMVLVPKVGEDE